MITATVKNLSGNYVLEPRLLWLQDVKLTTFYPGGLYGTATLFVPHAGRTPLNVRGGFELRLYECLELCWMGVITDLEEVRQSDRGGTMVSAVGHWGGVLGVRTLNKRWADHRITEDVWVFQETTSGADKVTLDRSNRIRFVPKAVAWGSGDYVACRYTMPTGQTIKRVVMDYQMQEAAQVWALRLRDVIAAANIWSVTSSGSGSQDVTLVTPRQYLELQFVSNAAQTPAADGSILGEIYNIMMYSETGTIDLTEIAKDVRAGVSELSSNEHLVATNGYDLAPFVTNYRERLTSILDRATAFGDGSQTPWAVGVRGAHLSSDDKPLLFAEAQPNLASVTPDYEVSLDGAQVSVRRNVGEVWNWVVVQYQDLRGFTQVATPDDDANLKDTDSIAKYGQREMVLDMNFSDLAEAKNMARRFLAKYKNPTYAITSPVRVTGYLRKTDGGYVPAALVQAGKTVRVVDFLPDLSGVGLVLLITSTSYDHATRTVDIGFGVPDVLGLAVMRRPVVAGASPFVPGEVAIEGADWIPGFGAPQGGPSAFGHGRGGRNAGARRGRW